MSAFFAKPLMRPSSSPVLLRDARDPEETIIDVSPTKEVSRISHSKGCQGLLGFLGDLMDSGCREFRNSGFQGLRLKENSGGENL